MEYIIDILIKMAPNVHYIAFGLLLLAGFNLPVSEDLVFIISASITATLVTNDTYFTYKVFIGCFLGAYFSDIIAYLIGRYGLKKLLKYKFFDALIPDEKIDNIDDYFIKYGGKTLFFGRFIPFGVRNVLFLTAGFIKMKFYKFLLVDLFALTITSTILFYIGYSFGKNYERIFPYLDKYRIIIFSAFITIILLILIIKKFKRKK